MSLILLVRFQATIKDKGEIMNGFVVFVVIVVFTFNEQLCVSKMTTRCQLAHN